MRQADRFEVILEELAARGSVEVADLCDRLDVSSATVRRDLQMLADQRFLTRTHGGAVAQGVMYELPLRYKAARRQEQKNAIAQEAVARVLEGSAIGLTGGTTTTEVARRLVDMQLTVVTNALNIANELAIRPNVKLVVTGGFARPESYELVGPLAEQSLAALYLDLVLIGVDGISPVHGLTTHHEVEAHTNRTLIERAHRVIVVADSSKIGAVAFARICELSDVDELITDTGADPDVLRTIAEADVEVTAV